MKNKHKHNVKIYKKSIKSFSESRRPNPMQS